MTANARRTLWGREVGQQYTDRDVLAERAYYERLNEAGAVAVSTNTTAAPVFDRRCECCNKVEGHAGWCISCEKGEPE